MVTPQAEPVPNDDRVFEYYRTIAEGIGIPAGGAGPSGVDRRAHERAAHAAHRRRDSARRSIKEEATPTPPKIRALLQGMRERKVPILTGLGALYAQFDLEAGSSGFNTGFAFPEVLMAMVKAMKAGDSSRVQALYTRFLPLIVFEQQPGVAVRKEILRLRGLIRAAAACAIPAPAFNQPSPSRCER